MRREGDVDARLWVRVDEVKQSLALIEQMSSQELIKNATGKPLSAAPWLRYAESKYLEQQ